MQTFFSRNSRVYTGNEIHFVKVEVCHKPYRCVIQLIFVNCKIRNLKACDPDVETALDIILMKFSVVLHIDIIKFAVILFHFFVISRDNGLINGRDVACHKVGFDFTSYIIRVKVLIVCAEVIQDVAVCGQCVNVVVFAVHDFRAADNVFFPLAAVDFHLINAVAENGCRYHIGVYEIKIFADNSQVFALRIRNLFKRNAFVVYG